MGVKTQAVLKAQFQGTDPNDHNTDVVDSLFATDRYITAAGRSGAGAITLTGAVVGDVVVGVAGLSTGALGSAASSFEATITVVNQIQQSSASNLSANNYLFVLRAAA